MAEPRGRAQGQGFVVSDGPAAGPAAMHPGCLDSNSFAGLAILAAHFRRIQMMDFDLMTKTSN